MTDGKLSLIDPHLVQAHLLGRAYLVRFVKCEASGVLQCDRVVDGSARKGREPFADVDRFWIYLSCTELRHHMQQMAVTYIIGRPQTSRPLRRVHNIHSRMLLRTMMGRLVVLALSSSPSRR